MNNDERGVLVWLGLVIVAFVACYRSTKKILPHSRWEGSAWLKAVSRAFPWALLLAPSMAFGAIPLPMPAGLLMIGWLWSVISHAPYLQGPHNATGPIACLAFALSWLMISAVTFLSLRSATDVLRVDIQSMFAYIGFMMGKGCCVDDISKAHLKVHFAKQSSPALIAAFLHHYSVAYPELVEECVSYAEDLPDNTVLFRLKSYAALDKSRISALLATMRTKSA